MNKALTISVIFLLIASIPALAHDGPKKTENSNTIMLFYVDWSVQCKKVKFEFKNKLTELCQNIGVETVLINNEQSPELKQKYNVQGHPTILFERADGQVVEYTGERTADAIFAFIQETLDK